MRRRERTGRPAVVLCSQNLPVPQDRRVWREATALSAADYGVTVVCPRGPGQRPRERLDGVDVRRYPAAPRLRGLAGQAVETLWSLAWVASHCLRLRLRRRLDVLHAANPPDTFFLVGLALRRLGARFVYDQHDLCPELLVARTPGAPSALRWLLLRLERASYRAADLVISPNNSYRRIARSRGGYAPERVVVVRSGPDRCHRPARPGRHGPLVVVFAGVMNQQDNVQLLLEAAAVVLRRRPGSLVVDLVGTGDDVPRLRVLTDELGITEAVRWAGWLDGDALHERIAAASIGVSIDCDDEFSRLSTMAKVPEYLGLGLPALLADLPENRVTAGDAALYFTPGQVTSLAACLDVLLEEPATLERLARAASSRAPALQWSHGARRLVAAYQWLLDGGPAVAGDQLVEGDAVPDGPIVSVVIDNFNYERFVGRAIESALAQTYPVEVIVVDDGSTDDSRLVIDGYRDAVKVIDKPNGGQASAFNAGFEASTGDIVLFLDADDELYPRAVEAIVPWFSPGVAKVHFRLDVVDSDGAALGYTNPPHDRRLADGDVARQLVTIGRYVCPPTSGNAFSRRALERVMPVPEDEFRISADGYVVNTVPFYGRVVALDERLGIYRVHGGNWWAPARIDAERLRAYVAHDHCKHAAVSSHARSVGATPASELWQHDDGHLRVRLGSLRLDPAGHAERDDRPMRLAWRGMLASIRSPGLRPRRRLLFTLWFAWVGLAPRAWAEPVVAWFYVPQYRPVPVRWLIRPVQSVRSRLRRRRPATSPGHSPAEQIDPDMGEGRPRE